MIIKINHDYIVDGYVKVEDDLNRFNDLVINTKNIFSIETYEKERGYERFSPNSEEEEMWTEYGLIINGNPLPIWIQPNIVNMYNEDLQEQASEKLNKLYEQIVDAMEKGI